MAFPTTGVLDAFTGVDNTKPPNANWTRYTGAADDWKISSNHIIPNSISVCGNYWNPTTFGPDTEIFCTVIANASGSSGAVLALTLRHNIASQNWYDAVFHPGASPATVIIRRVDGGSATNLSASTNITVNNNDKLGFSAVGNILTAWRFDGASWASLVTYDITPDGTKYTGTGRIAIAAATSTATTIDDVGGGTVAAAFLPRIGTVIVQ